MRTPCALPITAITSRGRATIAARLCERRAGRAPARGGRGDGRSWRWAVVVVGGRGGGRSWWWAVVAVAEATAAIALVAAPSRRRASPSRAPAQCLAPSARGRWRNETPPQR